MKIKTIEFFDTETVDNKTVLICNSEKYLWSAGGLTYEQCFDFLIDNAKDYNYFFRIDYDVNMIIKNLPKKNIIELFETNQTTYKNYKIKYYRNKIFEINKKRFFDIYNFFNTSLIRVIEILDIKLESDELKFLSLMKSNRANFKLKDKEKLIKYSLLENRIGLKIVKTILTLLPDELKTYSLYGASSLTNIFLKQKDVKKSYLFSSDLFEKSFFGGRMECLKIGTFKNVYKYDINSAYPNVIKDLREPVYFKIKKYNNEKIVDYNIYELSFNHKTVNEIGCLPVRLKSGYLVFPKRGMGIYYGCEVIEAIKRGVEVKIKTVIDVKLGKKLFDNEIEKYYELRKKLKLNNDKKNLIYKLLLNSIYGKFAQSVGKSPFRNLYLAGYITAKVRAQLLQATYKKDNDIIFFATDGILSKTKLNLPVNDNLGAFEEIKIKTAYVLLSGIYKLIDYNNKIYLGERGFRFDFDKAFNEIKKKNKYTVNLKVFISNIYAFKNYKKFLRYRCEFTTLKKIIDITNQRKRIFKTFDITKENNSLLLNDKHLSELNKLPIIDFTEFDDIEFDIL